jgi:hypothetical protein
MDLAIARIARSAIKIKAECTCVNLTNPVTVLKFDPDA